MRETNDDSEFQFGDVDSNIPGEGQRRTPRETTDPPRRVQYDSPKAEREAVTIYLEAEDIEQIALWEILANREFSERVHKTDVQNAAMRVGVNATDDRFLDAMREIGYDYFGSQ